jgi:hypothetical protein
MATSGEKRWPPVGNFVAASGEKPMAIDICDGDRPTRPGLHGPQCQHSAAPRPALALRPAPAAGPCRCSFDRHQGLGRLPVCRPRSLEDAAAAPVSHSLGAAVWTASGLRLKWPPVREVGDARYPHACFLGEQLSASRGWASESSRIRCQRVLHA